MAQLLAHHCFVAGLAVSSYFFVVAANSESRLLQKSTVVLSPMLSFFILALAVPCCLVGRYRALA